MWVITTIVIKTVIVIVVIIVIIMIIIITITIVILRFPAQDELGTCRTSLVSPEQPVLCVPVVHVNEPITNCGVAFHR